MSVAKRHKKYFLIFNKKRAIHNKLIKCGRVAKIKIERIWKYMIVKEYELHNNEKIDVKRIRRAAEKLNNKSQVEKKAKIQSDDISKFHFIKKMKNFIIVENISKSNKKKHQRQSSKTQIFSNDEKSTSKNNEKRIFSKNDDVLSTIEKNEVTKKQQTFFTIENEWWRTDTDEMKKDYVVDKNHFRHQKKKQYFKIQKFDAISQKFMKIDNKKKKSKFELKNDDSENDLHFVTKLSSISAIVAKHSVYQKYFVLISYKVAHDFVSNSKNIKMKKNITYVKVSSMLVFDNNASHWQTLFKIIQKNVIKKQISQFFFFMKKWHIIIIITKKQRQTSRVLIKLYESKTISISK